MNYRGYLEKDLEIYKMSAQTQEFLGTEAVASLNYLRTEALSRYVAQLFNIRDIRCGNGNRKEFYEGFNNLFTNFPALAISLLEKIPIYGGWMDIIALRGMYPAMKQAINELIMRRIAIDEAAMRSGNAYISLLGKWLPREGNRNKQQAKEIALWLWSNEPISSRADTKPMASYRKRCSQLNRALKTVEIFECAKKWHDIDPSYVPSGAILKKWNSYLNVRESPDFGRELCRENFMRWMQDGSPTVKVESWQSGTRYGPIVQAVQIWSIGGWRGVL